MSEVRHKSVGSALTCFDKYMVFLFVSGIFLEQAGEYREVSDQE